MPCQHQVVQWTLWTAGPPLIVVGDIRPRLASWNKSTDPAQTALGQYLDDLMQRIGTLPPTDAPLALQLDVDVEQPGRLLHQYDVENFLMPMFGAKRLPPSRFVLVAGRKHVGGGSKLTVSLATPAATPCAAPFFIRAGAGSQTLAWKTRILTAIEATAKPLPAGPASARFAFRCASKRNWTGLWKPTGDALGPLLGLEGQNRFGPCDGRIVELELHRFDDDALGHDVDVGVWCDAGARPTHTNPGS